MIMFRDSNPCFPSFYCKQEQIDSQLWCGAGKVGRRYVTPSAHMLLKQRAVLIKIKSLSDVTHKKRVRQQMQLKYSIPISREL